MEAFLRATSAVEGVHAVAVATHLGNLLCNLPTADVIPAVVLAAQLHTPLHAHYSAHVVLRVGNLDVVGIIVSHGIESVLANARTLTDEVDVFDGIQTVRGIIVSLVHSLGIVEISEGQTIGEALTARHFARLVVVGHAKRLACEIAVLRGIVWRAALNIVLAVVKEVVGAVVDGEPGIVERHGVVEARLAVSVHVVGVAGRYLALLACAILPYGLVGTALHCSREAFLYIARLRVGDGQAVLHEEGIDQSLINAEAIAAAEVTHRDDAKERSLIVALLRDGEGYLVVAFAPALDVHVVGRHERVNLAVGSHLLIKLIACSLSFVDDELASLSSLHPFVVVVDGVENLLALVVYIVGVPGIAVHQRTGSEEQHTRALRQGHDLVDAAVFRGILIDGGQGIGSFEHFLVAIVDDVVELSLTDQQFANGSIARGDVARCEGDATIVLGHQPPGVGGEEAHLGLHVVHLALRQVVIGHGLDHIIEDVAMTDALGHTCPEVAGPCAVNGPLAGNLTDALGPVPLLPALRGHHVVGHHLIAVAGEAPLVGSMYDGVVDIGQPGIHLVPVLEHHIGGELNVGLLVKIVAAGGKGRSCGDAATYAKCGYYMFDVFGNHNLQF